jgi:uncharacterized membrane protein
MITLVLNWSRSVWKKRSHIKTLWVLRTIIVAGLVAEISLIAAMPRSGSAIIAAQPEQYTELYFATPNQLPKQIEDGVPENVTFKVVNHTAKTTTYRINATLTADGVVTQLANRTVTLTDGATSNQTITINLPRPGLTGVVTITLPDQNQQIHFETKS